MYKKKPVAEFAGYIQLFLDEGDIAALDAAIKAAHDPLPWVASMVKQGYKLGMSYDIGTRSYRATMQNTTTGTASSGWMLSGESDSFLAALIVLEYKSTQKMANDWTPFCTETREAKRYR